MDKDYLPQEDISNQNFSPLPNKKINKLLTVGVLMFFVVITSGIYLLSMKNYNLIQSNSSNITMKFPAVSKTMSPTLAESKSINSTKRLNFTEINLNKTIISSPDNNKIATFYYKGRQRFEGDPTFSDVDILDKDSNKVITYHLTNEITYASDGPLFWSPIDNRIYFTLGTNGIGVYALWSSNVDGTNLKLVSGKSVDRKYTKDLVNSAVYGAVALDYSPNGKMIVTARQSYASNNQSPLWVMNYDGTNSHAVPIIGEYKDISAVSWDKDGKHIYFTIWNGKSGKKYKTDLNGSKPIQVTT